jgi:SAM-dependent methyltransferase
MKCPICHHPGESFTDPASQIRYHACPDCGYIHKDPEYYPDLARQKTRYDLHQNDPDDPGYRAYFQRFLDFVLPYIVPQGKALDFGSGDSNLLASMLSEAGFDAMHYDPIYHPDSAYASESFHLIVSTEVFEHLDDPLRILWHLAEHLKPGGFLALQTQFLPEGREAFLDWYYRLDPTHIGFFTPDTLEVMARACGMLYVADDGINKVLFQKVS